MIGLNVMLSVAASILFVGVIGEEKQPKQTNITIALVAVVALIIALNTIM